MPHVNTGLLDEITFFFIQFVCIYPRCGARTRRLLLSTTLWRGQRIRLEKSSPSDVVAFCPNFCLVGRTAAAAVAAATVAAAAVAVAAAAAAAPVAAAMAAAAAAAAGSLVAVGCAMYAACDESYAELRRAGNLHGHRHHPFPSLRGGTVPHSVAEQETAVFPQF